MRSIFAYVLLLALVPALCFGQLPLTGLGGNLFDLNVIVEASVSDSSTSNFILGTRGGIVQPFPTVSGGLKIGSDNILDHITDTGAQTVFLEVLYEDSPGIFTIREEVVEMNGTTEVITFALGGIGVRRIRRMEVQQVGNQELDPPAGRISAIIAGVPISEINPGKGRSEIAVWTTGPTRVELIAAIELRFSSAAAGGLDWQVTDSAISLRQFAKGYGWVTTGNVTAREPDAILPIAINVPLPVPILTDLRYKVGATLGSDRNITVRMQVTSLN